MQQERTFIDEIKYQYHFGGGTIKLILINLAIFIVINVLTVFAELIGGNGGMFINDLVNTIFGLKSDSFYWQPWTFFTSIFAHFGIIHLVFNMLFLYFAGKMFEQLFNSERLIYTYIIGGIAGGLLEILASYIFTDFFSDKIIVVGASGSIMAIFAAIAFYRPNTKVALFGLIDLKIIWLAFGFIFYDIISLALNDGTAHFAHLGGAIIGMISINNIHNSNNIITKMISFSKSIISFFQNIFKSKSHLKVEKGGNFQRPKTDEQFNTENLERQKKIDQILEKISKSGYESLTKSEKEFLFKQSNK